MARLTNEQKIIALLQEHAGLDDDEISRIAGISPRQQVNQICRRLEAAGTLRRGPGPRGKIVNHVVDVSRAGQRPPNVASPRMNRSSEFTNATGAGFPPRPAHRTVPRVPDDALHFELERTLFIIPCSGAKVEGGDATLEGPSILQFLPAPLASRLAEARNAVAERAQLDARRLMPAWQRYDGSLYQGARPALARIAAGSNPASVIILSGGYGLLLANEPIGMYEALFNRRDWPRGFLEEALMEFGRTLGVRAVRAIASHTTDYAKLIRGVSWREAGVTDAWLLSPEPAPGAMTRSPRAQGEALTGLVNGTLRPEWRSSDGLGVLATALV